MYKLTIKNVKKVFELGTALKAGNHVLQYRIYGFYYYNNIFYSNKNFIIRKFVRNAKKDGYKTFELTKLN